MKQIQLSQGKVAIVDDDDFVWLSQFNWCAHRDKCTFYADRGIGLPNGKRTTQKMHRAILEHHGHNIHGLLVDHRNHDGLDNQKENLRAGTNAQNLSNKTCHDDAFPGVTLLRGRWEADLKHNGKTIYIGRFDTAFEAALARDQYIVDHCLNFYPLNFPEVFGK